MSGKKTEKELTEKKQPKDQEEKIIKLKNIDSNGRRLQTREFKTFEFEPGEVKEVTYIKPFNYSSDIFEEVA
jgi:hypothetical protein